MIVTKELLKTEIDNVQDDYLDALYRIIKVFEYPPESDPGSRNDTPPIASQQSQHEWLAFVKETYGCLTHDPIERGEQGMYEIRESII